MMNRLLFLLALLALLFFSAHGCTTAEEPGNSASEQAIEHVKQETREPVAEAGKQAKCPHAEAKARCAHAAAGEQATKCPYAAEGEQPKCPHAGEKTKCCQADAKAKCCAGVEAKAKCPHAAAKEKAEADASRGI